MNIQTDGIYIDGTFGRGGHSLRLLERLGEQGRLLAFDQDAQAIAEAEKLLGKDRRVTLLHESFNHMAQVVRQENLTGKVNGIMLDLGVSSPQLDDPSRGFSFNKRGPLDMRMDTRKGLSAAEWINHAAENEITWVLRDFGEERFAKRIASAIVRERVASPFTDTLQLAETIAKAIPRWEKHKHPATRSFQAIRIYINDELAVLEECLKQTVEILAVGGRLAVISFHSLEDRLVKQFIRKMEEGDPIPRGVPVIDADRGKQMKKVGKAIKAGAKEVEQNPRARSAVLRVAEKVGIKK